MDGQLEEIAELDPNVAMRSAIFHKQLDHEFHEEMQQQEREEEALKARTTSHDEGPMKSIQHTPIEYVSDTEGDSDFDQIRMHEFIHHNSLYASEDSASMRRKATAQVTELKSKHRKRIIELMMKYRQENDQWKSLAEQATSSCKSLLQLNRQSEFNAKMSMLVIILMAGVLIWYGPTKEQAIDEYNLIEQEKFDQIMQQNGGLLNATESLQYRLANQLAKEEAVEFELQDVKDQLQLVENQNEEYLDNHVSIDQHNEDMVALNEVIAERDEVITDLQGQLSAFEHSINAMLLEKEQLLHATPENVSTDNALNETIGSQNATSNEDSFSLSVSSGEYCSGLGVMLIVLLLLVAMERLMGSNLVKLLKFCVYWFKNWLSECLKYCVEKWQCLSLRSMVKWLRKWRPKQEVVRLLREPLVRRDERKRWRRGPDGRLISYTDSV